MHVAKCSPPTQYSTTSSASTRRSVWHWTRLHIGKAWSRSVLVAQPHLSPSRVQSFSHSFVQGFKKMLFFIISRPRITPLSSEFVNSDLFSLVIFLLLGSGVGLWPFYFLSSFFPPFWVVCACKSLFLREI